MEKEHRGRGRRAIGAEVARRLKAGSLALSVLLGIGLNFTALDPIKALYWSAVVNGVLAAPALIMLMLLVRRRTVMGPFVIKGGLYGLGWASTFAMASCIVGMALTLFV